ncbi:restriction endonuclease [Nocardia panacis]|uniref:restriction endonuclease n=1 Tax=Nocardia panacis TaxID=2340916 RepID=UPI001315129A|nr:restriction endonuclease [Nocardia panacis]
MAIKVETVRGYVLEELLARLLQDNGYRLLVAADQDREALKDSGRGLLVRGRGTDHQVDVLGELDRPLPFSLPLRLFVEAKHRSDRTGIEFARNAYGTIRDVNEYYGTQTPGAYHIPMKRYQYQYALFSASGFTKPAQEYALAQQISLIDLSNPGFDALLAAADDIATRIVDLAAQVGLASLPLNQVRHALRHALGTWPANVDDEDFPDLAAHVRQMRGHAGESAFPAPAFGLAVAYDREQAGLNVAQLRDEPGDEYYVYEEDVSPPRKLPTGQLTAIVTGLGEVALDDFVLGFPPAPFVLVLLVDNPAAFTEYVDNSRNTDIRVNLNYPRDRRDNRPLSRDWEIEPVDGEAGFRLSFTLPTILADWMLGGEVPTWSLREAKTTLLSSIAMVRGNRVVRLLYQPHRG